MKCQDSSSATAAINRWPQQTLLARLCFSRFATCFLLSVTALLLLVTHLQAADLTASADYRNLTYDPAPSPSNSLAQTASIAIFGGSVGPVGSSTTPNDGQFYLWRSGFGQPVASLGNPDFLFGEEIVPDPALGVDLTASPVEIFPPQAAFYVSDAHKLFASDPGFVSVNWQTIYGTNTGRIRYLINPRPVRDPMAIYHTHNPGANLTNDAPQTLAPPVDVSGVTQIIFHWNTAIPNTGLPYLARVGNALYAKEMTGLIVLEYRSASVFIGLEILALRSDSVPDAPTTRNDIGDRLTPLLSVTNPALPFVSRGLDQITTANSYVYQHPSNSPSSQAGSVWAVKRSLSGTGIEVFWKRVGVSGVVWPYELHRYTSDWPTDRAKYQRYARGASPAFGADVSIPASLNASLMPFQEPAAHAQDLVNNRFITWSNGWSLLRYLPGNDVSFQVVHSVMHDDVSEYNLTPTNAVIGTEITEASHAGPQPGYLYEPMGNMYDAAAYLRPTNAQIFPVNRIPGNNLLEVWWYNLNQSVRWPSLVKRYTPSWPSNPEQLIIASQAGTPVFNTNYHAGLYIQNDPAQPGFNPNDEHAFPFTSLQGNTSIFAVRDDLGTPLTSAPYVLLKYNQAPDTNSLYGYRVVQVLATNSTNPFLYTGSAGRQISAPTPIQLLKGANALNWQQDRGILGPYFQDRKGYLWARAAGNDGGPADIMLHHYYPVQLGFYFPDFYLTNFPAGVRQTNVVSSDFVGALFPWLDLRNTPRVPLHTTYRVSWPILPPDLTEIEVGQTLLANSGQTEVGLEAKSVDIIYHQSLTNGTGESLKLIAPLAAITVTNVNLTAWQTLTGPEGQLRVFPSLPSSLRTRLIYDPFHYNGTLTFSGDCLFRGGSEPLVLPNVISSRDLGWLNSANSNAPYLAGITRLASAAAAVQQVLPDQPFDIGNLALTAGAPAGTGFVTIVVNNSTNLLTPTEQLDGGNDPSLYILKVVPRLHRGAIQIVSHSTDSPISDKVTLRFNGEMAGRPDDYEFIWKFSPNASAPEANWLPFNVPPRPGAQPGEPAGRGAVEITIQGPGPVTLSDNYYKCQYRPLNPSNPIPTNIWSAWTDPISVDGWIKRATANLNLFNQSYQDLQNGVNIQTSVLGVAGKPWHGNIPFNQDALASAGLIEKYGSIFRRGIELSLTGLHPIPYDPGAYGNLYQALILGASKYSDLYMLLGNEAFADAADPTIGIGANFTRAASAMFCFEDRPDVPHLLAEELTLLRGTSTAEDYPVYNRLRWNFSGGLGQVAYVNNYNIRLHGNTNSSFGPNDAALDFPQAHGDAWGHYLTAIKSYYVLLQATNFAWTTTNEVISTGGGSPIIVNYQYERKFAAAAVAKAKTGQQVVELNYRANYSEDPTQQYQGYPDGDSTRAWGVSEWGSRVGEGALYDWIVGNAILPPPGTNTSNDPNVVPVDRVTVTELRDLAGTYQSTQQYLDDMDVGLNPLGLAKNVVPFGIDSHLLDTAGKTHFEQIYDRSVTALNNAVAVFNYANDSTQMLRQRADNNVDFANNVQKQEQDYNNRLVELFGTPYADDIGAGKTYPGGYTGPDTENFHFLINDTSELIGVPTTSPLVLNVNFKSYSVNTNGALSSSNSAVQLLVSPDGFGLVKPATWTGTRSSPGEIQRSFRELVQAKGRLDKSLADYDNLLQQIQDQGNILTSTLGLNADEITVLRSGTNVIGSLDSSIRDARRRELTFQMKARIATIIGNALAEALPKTTGPFAFDTMSVARSLIMLSAATASESANQEGNIASLAELDYQQAKELSQSVNNIELTSIRQKQAFDQQKGQLVQITRQEAPARLDIYTILESVNQAADNYRAVLAKGQRLLEERLHFRQQTAAAVQSDRYKDLAFRIFRNDALQKYRAQFDLAARYVYLTAKAYDYETCLLPANSKAGQQFLQSIVRKRAIGEIANGVPIQGTGQQDPGLADPLKTLYDNFAVLKPDLGINNPVTRDRLFSLRTGLFRIAAGAGGSQNWRTVLRQHVVQNLWALPEYRKFCTHLRSETASAGHEPGIVIEFSTVIDASLNFFGWPAGVGDAQYNSTYFSHKIRTQGLWFSNYDPNQTGVQYPLAYLIPVGSDVLRSPTDHVTQRSWSVVDQKIPIPVDFTGNPPNYSIDWIPIQYSLSDTFAQIRPFNAIEATTDGQNTSLDTSKILRDSRLVGRSVWNTRWILVIPGLGLLGSDPDEGLNLFIDGVLSNGVRNGSGVIDIKLYFDTYQYSG